MMRRCPVRLPAPRSGFAGLGAMRNGIRRCVARSKRTWVEDWSFAGLFQELDSPMLGLPGLRSVRAPRPVRSRWVANSIRTPAVVTRSISIWVRSSPTTQRSFT